MTSLTAENPRLRWLLRRGMKELDVVVTRYYERHYASAGAVERAAFERMLETAEDPDIYAWIMDYSPVPAEYVDVVGRFRNHA